MNAIKRVLRTAVYSVPGTQALWVRIHQAAGRGPKVQFSGWGMETRTTAPPWADGGGGGLTRDFMHVNAEIAARVADGRMRLSQFASVQDKGRLLRELMWRHYIVFWSARYACHATAARAKNLVECGVCDGLTAYIAITAARNASTCVKAFLYDAWQGMKAEYLVESEKASVGQYSYLSLENTRRNLEPFAGDAVYIKGFIPESLASPSTPSELVWLHIDLNSALPTAAALEALFDRIPPGGVVLFDDYGWLGWRDTKAAIDNFVEGKRGALLPIPTGQAIFFKH